MLGTSKKRVGGCFGTSKKRVGARLRKLKSSDKAPLSDGKSLSGKRRLTEEMINKLQDYFRIGVKIAIGTVLYHCSDANNLETSHQLCPKLSGSCCQFQTDKCNGTSLHIEKLGIPSVIRDKIRPIFVDKRDKNLLSKCSHGKTQNNELINNVIWKRCLKDVSVRHKTLEFVVA